MKVLFLLLFTFTVSATQINFMDTCAFHMTDSTVAVDVNINFAVYKRYVFRAQRNYLVLVDSLTGKLVPAHTVPDMIGWEKK